MKSNYYKEYYICIIVSNPNNEDDGHPVQRIQKHIDLAKMTVEGYSYWGTDTSSGLRFYKNRKKNVISYEEIISGQSKFKVLFFIGKNFEGFNRVYAVADIIGFEIYKEKEYSKNPLAQVKDDKTNEVSKHKYWYKLENFEILSSEDSNYNLNDFFYETQESITKGLDEEVVLRKKFDEKDGERHPMLMVYKYHLKEYIKDETLQMEIINCNLNEREDTHYTHQPKAKLPQSKTSENTSYERDVNVAINALKFANHCCEYSGEHKSFNRKKDGFPYMEAHHLIPMKYSDDFEYSLDIEENVVSLCSHCHNQIHYGKQWEEILKVLYEQRKDMLKLVGLKISYEKLKQYYE